MGLVPLSKKTQENWLALSSPLPHCGMMHKEKVMRGHSGMVAPCKRRGLRVEGNHGGTLTLDFQPPEL